MNLTIKNDACIGCGMCVSNDAEHFGFNDSGFAEVISNENLDSSKLEETVDMCPTSAIIFSKEAVAENKTQDCACNPCNCQNCECKND